MCIGKGFTANRNCCFSSDNDMMIGNDVLLGWNVNIRTSDGHPLFKVDDRKKELNPSKSVHIGEHVWLAANVDIMKGVCIPDNCIVGYRSCVTKPFDEQYCVIAGFPAKIVKHNVCWERDRINTNQKNI